MIPPSRSRLFEAGAAGFVLKGGELAELAHAAKVVAGGGTFVDAEIAAALNAPPSERPPLLTRREREVLRLLAEGFRNDEVAELPRDLAADRAHTRPPRDGEARRRDADRGRRDGVAPVAHPLGNRGARRFEANRPLEERPS